MADIARVVNNKTNKSSSVPIAEPDRIAATQQAAMPAQTIQHLITRPSIARPAEILQLQRILGNRSVNSLLSGSVQKRPLIQAKLTVNAPGDIYEQEADRVAEQVMRMPTVQRNALDEKAKPSIMRISDIQRDGEAAVDVDANVERRLSASRGQGQPLPTALREDFESKFGVDFSAVRIHTDVQSDALNRSIQAKAFTTGQDVFFRHGVYAPESRDGQALLAHELTHVVQQTHGVMTPKRIQRIKVLEADDITVSDLTPAQAAERYFKEQTQVYLAFQGVVGEDAAKEFLIRLFEFIHDKQFYDEDSGSPWGNIVSDVDPYIDAAPTDATLATVGIKKVLKDAATKAEMARMPEFKADIRTAKEDNPGGKVDIKNGGFRISSPGMKIEAYTQLVKLGNVKSWRIGWVQNMLSATRICTSNGTVVWSEKLLQPAIDTSTKGGFWYDMQQPTIVPITAPKSYANWMLDTPATPLNGKVTSARDTWQLSGQDHFVAWMCAIKSDGKGTPICIAHVEWKTTWDVNGNSTNANIGPDHKAEVITQGNGKGNHTLVITPRSFEAVVIAGSY